MRIGVDFGTTRIVVAAADRGNYPLVHFETPEGQSRDWFPPVAAIRGNERIYGWDAVAVQSDADWTVVRSLKRWLRTAGPQTELDLGGYPVPLRLLLVEMMAALRKQLLERSNLGADPNEPLEIVLGVPANANSNQRFLTEDAAQTAGFVVLGIVNEPSAAAIEYAASNSKERKGKSGSGLLVYDLGGGTFDVSLVTLGENEHVVEATDGLPTVGGDNFDELLADLAIEYASPYPPFSHFERRLLLEECRDKKESLNPNSRRISLDLELVRAGLDQVTIAVDTYYERCRPLIEATRFVTDYGNNGVKKILAVNGLIPPRRLSSKQLATFPLFLPWPLGIPVRFISAMSIMVQTMSFKQC